MADGIPSQLKKLNERIDEIEASQETIQRVIDDEVIPAVGIAKAKAEAALEEVSKAVAKVSKKADRRPRKRRK